MKKYPMFNAFLIVAFFNLSMLSASPQIDQVTFHKITSPVASDIKAVTWVNNSLCIAVTSDGKVLRSEDAALSWTAFESGTTKPLNDVSFLDETIGIAVGGEEQFGPNNTVILLTTDLGLTWQPQTATYDGDALYSCDFSNRPETGVLQKSAMGEDSYGFLGGENGILYTILAAAISSTTNWAYFFQAGFNSLNVTIMAVYFILAVGFMVGGMGFLGITNDGGETWTEKDSGTNENLNDVAHNDNHQNVAAVGDNGAFVGSTDDGENWSAYTSGTTENINGVASFESGSTTLFTYVTDNGGIFIKEGLDGTPTPALLSTGSNLEKISAESDFLDIAISRTGVAVVVGTDGAIYRAQLPAAPLGPTIITAAPVSGTAIEISWEDNSDNEDGFNIYRKISSDAEYALIGTADANATSFVDENYVQNETNYYKINSYNDVGESSTSAEINITITGTDDYISTPNEYSLSQNYPNPFNPTTTISYELAQTSYVKLEVFDLVGKKIAQLVDEEQSSGKHHVLFDASELSSGTYVYRIISGDFVAANKMILIK